MHTSIRVALVGSLAGLCACAHTPAVSMHYYYSRADLGLKVVRTVACDESNHPMIANAVTPTVKYSADRQEPPATISLAGLRGALSDTDLKFEFYDDGRLKAVNATTTGQGETILKSAFAFFGPILGMDGGSPEFPEQCALIKSWAKDKPITLSYEGELDPGRPQGTSVRLKPDPASTFYAEKLAPMIGGVCAKITGHSEAMLPVEHVASNGDILLPLRQPGSTQVEVTAGNSDACGPVVWSGYVLAGQAGAKYALPIPRAAAFGKQVFAVAVNESGSLGSVQYAHTNGAAQAFNAATNALDALDGSTTAQKAQEAKAEADLIAAQQRLVACRAKPASCK